MKRKQKASRKGVAYQNIGSRKKSSSKSNAHSPTTKIERIRKPERRLIKQNSKGKTPNIESYPLKEVTGAPCIVSSKPRPDRIAAIQFDARKINKQTRFKKIDIVDDQDTNPKKKKKLPARDSAV